MMKKAAVVLAGVVIVGVVMVMVRLKPDTTYVATYVATYVPAYAVHAQAQPPYDLAGSVLPALHCDLGNARQQFAVLLERAQVPYNEDCRMAWNLERRLG